MIQRAKVLTEDLLEVVRGEHQKAVAQIQQQQMELHQAQLQYAAYTAAMSVCIILLIPVLQAVASVNSFLPSTFASLSCAGFTDVTDCLGRVPSWSWHGPDGRGWLATRSRSTSSTYRHGGIRCVLVSTSSTFRVRHR
jgi:hypothetical protein